MNSKSAWDNPLLLGRGNGDVTMDPDVVTITSKCSRWTIDPICLDAVDECNEAMTSSAAAREMLGQLTTRPIHLTFRSKTLANNARRSNWLRTTASLGGGGAEKFSGMPLRAVWTIGSSAAPSAVSTSVLDDNYETCLGRLYGKCVEIEVLLPKTKTTVVDNNFIRRLVLGRRGSGSSSSSYNGKVEAGRPPPSVVYRVPIQSGHVNPMGMTSKCRALVTLYPRGRTVSSASSSSATGGSSSSSNNSNDDVVINLGLTNIHLPLGPGLVDPSWSKGRKVFWKGRSVGLV